VAVLVFAIWQAVRPVGDGGAQVVKGPGDTAAAGPSTPGDTGKGADPKQPDDAQKKKEEEERRKADAQKQEEARQEEEARRKKEEERRRAARLPKPPSEEQRAVGQYVKPVRALPDILVSRAKPADAWQRLASGQKVQSTDALVSLPGYHSELSLDGGVGLTLWGSTYEFNSPLLESAVVLYAPEEGFDADFALDRGAVLLANRKDKDPAKVRVRFQGEVWDVSLVEPGSEVGLTLFSRQVQPYGTGQALEGPDASLHLFVLKGRASVNVSRFVEHENLTPGAVPVVLFWDNKNKGVQGPTPARDPESQAMLAVFSKPQLADVPQDVKKRIEDTYVALDEVSKKLSGTTPVETALVQILQPGGATRQLNGVLAVRCLGALDAVPDLINTLNDEQMSPLLRIEAIYTLRHWVGRNDGQDAKLYDPDKQSGYLTAGKKFRPTEASIVMELLHPFGQQQLADPDTWAYLIDKLKNDRLAIRELAYFHLARLVPDGRKIPYNPGDAPDGLQRGYEQWKKLIPDGKLPPAPPR
jgi:hypothetical protein